MALPDSRYSFIHDYSYNTDFFKRIYVMVRKMGRWMALMSCCLLPLSLQAKDTQAGGGGGGGTNSTTNQIVTQVNCNGNTRLSDIAKEGEVFSIIIKIENDGLPGYFRCFDNNLEFYRGTAWTDTGGSCSVQLKNLTNLLAEPFQCFSIPSLVL